MGEVSDLCPFRAETRGTLVCPVTLAILLVIRLSYGVPAWGMPDLQVSRATTVARDEAGKRVTS